jgi:bifunctional non-homologous end joining protein LigD
MLDRLRQYRAKRDFSHTPEPVGRRRKAGKKLAYVIQKHAARRLHYDFRLEWNGALLSWAVPKGPSENRSDKRLAVRVEDHPIEYGSFEGTIPQGEYGGGTVMLWDRGYWQPHDDPTEGLKKGKLSFELHGKRLHGSWALVRIRSRERRPKAENWLLIKEKDNQAPPKGKLAVDRETTSVKSGRGMEEIAKGKKVWHSARQRDPTPNRKPNRRSNVTLPPFVEPQLASLVDEPPRGDQWLHEIKLDGYRAITSVAGDRVVIRTRKGLDWTDKFETLVAPLSQLPCDSALLDGEIAIADADGHTDFGALQDALSNGSGGFAYYLFDLLHLDGRDLRALPLHERKRQLQTLLKNPGKGIAYSSHIAGEGARVFSRACDLKLEGIISKRADDPYRSGRTNSWLKVKCGLEQEFVIVGWRPSDKAGRQFRSLLLAVREGGELRYAGRVGTGYSDKRLVSLSALFKKHGRKKPAATGMPPAIARHAHFVDPVLVAEVAFQGWTRDGLIRQGSFKGLRGDKPPREIVREEPMQKTKALRAGGGADEVDGIRLTHPDRVLFAEQGVSKRELAEYYASVAELMLPHIGGRPLALVRCPRGYGGDCFFQKHASAGWPEALRKIRIREKSGADDYLYVDDVAGLVAAVQMGVLELHVWGSRADAVERPDRMVFDFDPDEGLPFARVQEAAKEMRARLRKLGLESFPMATGGKGIHVVVPLTRKHSWDEHRQFAEALARMMAADDPARYVANMSKAKRRGKIFVDYLRNQRGATAISPYSTRSRKGAYIATPVSWAMLARLSNAHPTSVKDVKKLVRAGDPWEGYFKIRQALPRLKD